MGYQAGKPIVSVVHCFKSFSVVTQRSSSQEALRDDTKKGCVADGLHFIPSAKLTLTRTQSRVRVRVRVIYLNQTGICHQILGGVGLE